MKPEMARLLYEIVAATSRASGQMLTLDELYRTLGADTASAQDKLRNAVARLSGSRHLKKVSTGYAYLRDYEPEPPPVPTLFPEPKPVPRTEKPRPTVSVSKGNAKSIEELRASLTPAPAKAVRGSVKEWVLQTLEDNDGPFAVSELCTHAVEAGITKSEKSVHQCLGTLYRKGLIAKPKYGYYQSLRAAAAPESRNGDSTPAPHVVEPQETESVRPKGSLPDDAIAKLAGDVDTLSRLVESWKEELAMTERRGSELRLRIAKYEEILMWRREVHGWCTDTVEDSAEEARP